MTQLTFRPLGVDFFCLGKKFLAFNLLSRNLKIKYRRSFLGAFWTLLAPTATAIVYYVVFKKILRVSVPHYLAFVLTGILPWNFFSQSALEGMESLVGNGALISKVPVPVQMFPYVGTITNLVTLLIALPIMIVASIVSDVHLGPSLLLMPVYFGLLFLITYSFGLILAIAFVFFRDLRHIMGIFIQLLFYGTPVLYDVGMVPEKWRWVLRLNPLADLFAGMHAIMVGGTWPDAASAARVVGWALLFSSAAVLVQKNFASGLVEQI